MEKHCLDEDRIFLIRGLLLPDECQRFIRLSEEAGYEAAPISTESGTVLDREVRDNARLVHDSSALAEYLWHRVAAFIPVGREGWRPVGLWPSFRFYRYAPGQKFARHFDGYVEGPSGETSYLTFLVYLNDDFSGGETCFYPFHLDEPIRVRPERGTALVFVHRQLHEGMAVLGGRKYVLRSEVMYRQEEAEEARLG